MEKYTYLTNDLLQPLTTSKCRNKPRHIRSTLRHGWMRVHKNFSSVVPNLLQSFQIVGKLTDSLLRTY